MTDMNMDQEIQRLVDETKEEIDEVRKPGQPVVDIGVENMTRTAELLVQATQEGAAELAKRFMQTATAMVDEATRVESEVQAFNKRLLEHAGLKAQEFHGIFQRFRTAALALTQVMEALTLPRDEPKQ